MVIYIILPFLCDMPFINVTKEYVFIGNARTASTSIYRDLYNSSIGDVVIWEKGLDAKPWLYHMSLADTIKRYPFCSNYFKLSTANLMGSSKTKISRAFPRM